MLNKPAIIEHEKYKFMILSAPDDNSLNYWIEQFKAYNVTDIVRLCERTYSDDLIMQNGIRTHELKFNDGEFPNKYIIKSFLNIISQVYNKKNNKDKDYHKNDNRKASTSSKINEYRVINKNLLEGNFNEINNNNNNNNLNVDVLKSDKTNKYIKEEEMQPCIAVHCIAGLGRSPLLIAIALIELGMDYKDAVELIRYYRKGAINLHQSNQLSKYKRLSQNSYCCIIY